MALIGYDSQLALTGITTLAAFASVGYFAFKEPVIEIIPLPEGDYMADGWQDEDRFKKALRKFLIEKDGLSAKEADIAMDNLTISKTYRAIVDLFGEHWYLPSRAGDPGSFNATIGRIA